MAKIRENGFTAQRQHLSFAKHDNMLLNIDRWEEESTTDIGHRQCDLKHKENGTDHKTADGGGQQWCSQLRGNVGSGDKEYRRK